MYIIIIGSKMLTDSLSHSLAKDGNDICIFDRDMDKRNYMNDNHLINRKIRRMPGMEIDCHRLKEAGIEDADILLAITQDDNVNIMVALMAKKMFNVPKVVAMVNDINKVSIYDKFDISIISLVQIETEIFKSIISP